MEAADTGNAKDNSSRDTGQSQELTAVRVHMSMGLEDTTSLGGYGSQGTDQYEVARC